MTKIVVLGSTNVDTILGIQRFPQPGETLAMNSRSVAGGGKGANQAIAAVRSGAQTAFISKIGHEGAADFMLETFKQDGMNIDHVTMSETAGTGQAYIMVDESGQNSILIYGGANQDVTSADIHQAENDIKLADRIVAQFEVPVPAVIEAFKIARANGVQTILNPAPAIKNIPAELLAVTDMIVPNETEAEIITGIKVTDQASMQKNAEAMFKMGIKVVIITVGDKGSFYATPDQTGFVPAFKVTAVDTTAAGDTFIGALSTKLAMDYSNIEVAMTYANKASSIAVQTKGAQNSIPYAKDIQL
ncbi:ribokinase [Latilactobacillus fuchuensis]|uniref:Ribokinase n=1 Tax=Latilactobacillus fuchuensis DSM 14340 = JCM 11249 TaxID=1423747 RepID=A0A0R1S2K3_9LACO|nr:ribokinase [Latilactobacillus fuchuensis]KRL59675.1 ribokinase [Latilactobacillus fuchuensis DSM 14340 = JCM 11249]